MEKNNASSYCMSVNKEKLYEGCQMDSLKNNHASESEQLNTINQLLIDKQSSNCRSVLTTCVFTKQIMIITYNKICTVYKKNNLFCTS